MFSVASLSCQDEKYMIFPLSLKLTSFTRGCKLCHSDLDEIQIFLGAYAMKLNILVCIGYA